MRTGRMSVTCRRDGVAVARPVDEAVDAAQAVGDAGGVVGVPGQRQQVLALLGEALEGGASVSSRWSTMRSSQSASCALMSSKSRNERPLRKDISNFPEVALDAGLSLGVAAHGERAETRSERRRRGSAGCRWADCPPSAARPASGCRTCSSARSALKRVKARTCPSIRACRSVD